MASNNIGLWSTTAASNNFSTSLGGWPENMLASTVNNAARKNMADVRSAFEEYPFFDYGHNIVQVSTTSFTAVGNLVTVYSVNRRIKYTSSDGVTETTGTGRITSSSYSGGTGLTTVVFTPDAAVDLQLLQRSMAVEMAVGLDSLPVATTTGGTTVYAISLPGITAYHDKVAFFGRINATNTGASTINVNSLGARDIYKGGITAVASGDLALNTTYGFVYDGTGFQVVGIGGSGGAPTDATYIVQTANGSLSNEQALGALATGILKNTTTTGVLSIATAGTDYYNPSGTDVALADGGTGASLTDPNADRIMFWDDSAGVVTWLEASIGLTLSGTTLEVSTAAQSDQETATSTTTYVSPGRQHFHPSAAKAWVKFTSITTTSILVSYNVTSLTDNGVGDTTINFTTAFSTAHYAGAGMTFEAAASVNAGFAIKNGTTPTALAINVVTQSGGTRTDVAHQSAVFFGDI